MLTLAALLLVGCGGYTLSGKVISGAYSDLEITSADDSRFSETGVGQVKIMVHRDPLTLNQKLQATGRSHTDGTFEIPISGFGAGWMDETWLIEVERGGYSSGQMIMRLPTGSSKLLITVSKGPSMPHEPREDLWEQYEKYK
jgi:hypothetical protein